MIIYLSLISLAAIYCYLINNNIIETLSDKNFDKLKQKKRDSCKDADTCKNKKFNIKAVGRLVKKYNKNIKRFIEKIGLGIAALVLFLVQTLFCSPLILLDLVKKGLKSVGIEIYNTIPKWIITLAVLIITPLGLLFLYFAWPGSEWNKREAKDKTFFKRLKYAYDIGKDHPTFPTFVQLSSAYILFSTIMLVIKHTASPLYNKITKFIHMGTVEDTERRFKVMVNTFPTSSWMNKNMKPTNMIVGSKCNQVMDECDELTDQLVAERRLREQRAKDNELDDLKSVEFDVRDELIDETKSSASAAIALIVIFLFMYTMHKFFIKLFDKRNGHTIGPITRYNSVK